MCPSRSATSSRPPSAASRRTGFLRDLVLREASFKNKRVLLDEIRQWRASPTVTASGDDVLTALNAARAAQDAKNLGT